MFFLGISAHLFIYLLLPAFLGIYFYFKGVAGNPKVDSLLSETVICREAKSQVSQSDYFYELLFQKENKSHKKETINVTEVFSFDLPVYLVWFLPTPIVKHQALRAPPHLIRKRMLLYVYV